jgi:DNA invertase Pin-like site-specific DNA recombinase
VLAKHKARRGACANLRGRGFRRPLLSHMTAQSIRNFLYAISESGTSATLNRRAEVKRLLTEGVRPTAIAKRLGISRASLYRILS